MAIHRPIAAAAAFLVVLLVGGAAYALTSAGSSDERTASLAPHSSVAAVQAASPSPALTETPAPAPTATPIPPAPTPLPASPVPAVVKPSVPAPAPTPAPTIVVPPPAATAIAGLCAGGGLTAEGLATRNGVPLGSFPGGASTGAASLYQVGNQLYVRGADGCFTSPSSQVVAICVDGSVLLQPAPDCGSHGGLLRRIDLSAR